MIKTAIACLATLTLCAGCLTKEDLDCWYDDMCMNAAGHAPGHLAGAPHGISEFPSVRNGASRQAGGLGE